MSFSKLRVTFFVNSNSLNKMPFHEILQIWKCMYICVFRYLFHIPFSDFGGKYCQGKFVPMWVSDVLKHLSHHPLGKWKWYQRHWKGRRTTSQSRLISLCFLHIILIDIKWDHIASEMELGTHMGNINSQHAEQKFTKHYLMG